MKSRICPDCGNREVEKYCEFCSECGEVRRQISLDIARHTYSQSDKGKEFIRNYQSAYEKSDKCKARRKEKRSTEEYRKYRREYMKNYRRSHENSNLLNNNPF